jgi:diguanylate cyclase (GGDEF)-like protein
VIVMAEQGDQAQSPAWFAWLLALPPQSERMLRMEALIARIRLMVLCVNTLCLAFLLDTRGMHLNVAWALVIFSYLYGLPLVVLQPYRRWRVFQTSLASSAIDSIAIAIFIGATGGSHSPFFPLYFLSATAVAMRFELRQAIVACGLYAFMYALAYFATWEQSSEDLAALLVRCSYMLFIAVGVGQLASEESSRSLQVEEIERLNAQNAKLLSRKEKEARIDRLTGLLNRPSLEKDALRELKRARATGGYLSVLFCDMDRLKRINDDLGHDAGDRVLRQAGVALKKGLRSQDLVGRFGGDEFVVVLPSLTRETAFERADQLIENMKQLNEGLPGELTLGLSVGIATFPFDAPDYPTLVKLADQAMYLAKREGGNRVRTANDLRLFWEEAPRTA